jgi:predicted nucleic-acid-binding protein
MIGLDTNVLVRYLTQDHPVQSSKATRIIEHELTEQNLGFVSVVVMVETVWVLDRSYGFSAHEIAAVIEGLLQTAVLFVENEREVFTAMITLKQRRGEFADALIAALGSKAGCDRTLTFDRGATRIAGFELL